MSVDAAAAAAPVAVVLQDTPATLMDDSGRSVQPFFLEGDSFLLHLLAGEAAAGTLPAAHATQTLHFLYLLEARLARLTEGHREVHVVFFDAIGNELWGKSPVYRCLRALAQTHLAGALKIPVESFATADDKFLSYCHRGSPLFTVVGDGFVPEAAKEALGATVVAALPAVQPRLKALLMWLLRRDLRVVRCAEMTATDGMLSGLLVTGNVGGGAAAAAGAGMDIVGTAAAVAVTGGGDIPAANGAIIAAGAKPTARTAVAVAAAKTLLSSSDAAVKSVAVALLLHAVLLETMTLHARAQPQAIVDALPAPLVKAVVTVVERVCDTITTNTSTSTDIDVIDVLDARLLSVLVVKQAQGKLPTKLPAALDVLFKAAGGSGDAKTVLAAGIAGAQVSVAAAPAYPAPPAVTGNTAADRVRSLAEQWRQLPAIEPTLLRLLLSQVSDGSAEAAAAVEAAVTGGASAAAAAAAKPAAAAAAAASPEEPVDDWDAEETPAAAAPAAAPEADAGGDADWEEEADDWEAEAAADEASAAEAAAAAAAAKAAEEAKAAELAAAVAAAGQVPAGYLGGALLPVTAATTNAAGDAVAWDCDVTLPDGATSKPGLVEQHVGGNAVVLRADTRIMLQKLLDNCRNARATEMSGAWRMPSDEDIRKRVMLARHELTMDKAKAWFRSAIEIKVKKAMNKAAARADSTKNEYIKSMKTPVRIVLRDVVATQGADEQDSDDDEEEGNSINATDAGGDGNEAAEPTKVLTGKEKAAAANAARAAKKGAAAAAGGAKHGAAKPKVADIAAAQVQAKLAADAMREVESFILNLRAGLDTRIEKLDERLLGHADKPSALHGLLVLLKWRVEQWRDRVENRARTSAGASTSALSAVAEAHMEVAVRLYQLLCDIARRFVSLVSPAQLEEVCRGFALLGFLDSVEWLTRRYLSEHPSPDMAVVMELQEAYAPGRPLSTAERRFNVGMSRARFVLQHCGHTLLRNVKSAADHRVSGFFPDRWQRKLLDIVDRSESALVVAPTSAGKTLVSFYTVEQVARQNRQQKSSLAKGVVVFVAPNMALARQMESDIIMRSSATVAVHDQHTKLPPSLHFDVLVTLPGCIETLLLSPERQRWAQRIRYVVLDEVHAIGAALAGPTWERVFLLIAHAPFLALSATVGGADRFHAWLRQMRSSYSVTSKGVVTVGGLSLTSFVPPAPQVHKVVVGIRWSHLHHYFYVPALPFVDAAIASTTAGGDDKASAADPSLETAPLAAAGLASDAAGSFVPIHPCATVAGEADERRADVSLLSNVEFSASDLLALHDAMVAAAANSPRFHPPAGSAAAQQPLPAEMQAIAAELASLHPDVFFGPSVEKLHVLQYEHAVKRALQHWHDAQLDTEILEAIDSLGASMKLLIAPLTAATRARREMWIGQLLPMLRQLRDREWFPAIVFCLDRSLCSELALRLVAQLEEEELAQWQQEGNARLDTKAAERELERQLKAAKKSRDGLKKGSGSAEASKEAEEEARMGLADDASAGASGPTARELDPYAWGHAKPDPRFSFVKDTETIAGSDLTYWEARARKRKAAGLDGKNPLVKALFRGFGVHHTGVDRVYRDLVEVFFRQRNLKFVLATETLGLGVNMPCRTCVFAFSTAQLNPLNYRQMAGRAGRRGFDDKGQVVFFGVDPRAACRLVTSSLTDLRGHHPLSAAAVLRVLVKHAAMRDANAVHATANNAGTTTNTALLDADGLLARSFFAFSQQGAGYGPKHASLALAHHLRFCLAYFAHLHLLPTGAPASGLAHLGAALSAAGAGDAGVFALLYLLRTGTLDALCADFRVDEDTKRDTSGAALRLMTVLATLFHPLPLRAGATRADFSAESPSLVVMPPLPEAAAAALADHDALVLRVFARCAAATAGTATSVTAPGADPSTDECALPLSKIAPVDSPATAAADADTAALVAGLAADAVPAVVRAPLSALQGRGDCFSSLAELTDTAAVAAGAAIGNASAGLPLLPHPATVQSAYALDFWRHGEYYDLVRTHGIARTDAWDALAKHHSTLHALHKGLARLCSGGEDDEDDDEEEEEDADAAAIAAAAEANKGPSRASKVRLMPPEQKSAAARTARCAKYVYEQFQRHFKAIARDQKAETGAAQ